MVADGSGEGEAAAFWEARYRDRPQVWSGNVNAVLARETADLVPGTALDLGSGEGGDAIWLAERGWKVTAIDIAQTALRRGADRAAALGVAERISWEAHDLARSFPDGSFDLVSAQFLQSPVALPRAQVVRAAVGAVAVGGTLLVVSHAAAPPWAPHPRPDVTFPTPAEDLAHLRLAPGQWQVARCETADRQAPGPDGRSATFIDSVLLLHRNATGRVPA